MAKFSAKEVRKILQETVDDATQKLSRDSEFRNKATEIIKDAMYNIIKENVYDSYSPTMYERRGDNDGLIDRENTEVNFDGNKIIAGNIAEPNESLIGTPIISENKKGLLYEWMDKGRIGMIPTIPQINHYSWRRARMGLTEKVYNELHSDHKLKEAVAKSIKKTLK